MLYFSDVSDVLLQSIFKLNDDEKLSYKYYNKRITTREQLPLHKSELFFQLSNYSFQENSIISTLKCSLLVLQIVENLCTIFGIIFRTDFYLTK